MSIGPEWSRWRSRVFVACMAFAALTGFAQMPIFKRYYIADLPGLGWLAQFYTTYTLHHLSAVILVAVCVYWGMDFLLRQRRDRQLTGSGWTRLALLIALGGTGTLLVVRNLPGYRFSPLVASVLDFSHLGLVMVMGAVAMSARIRRWPWTIPR